MSALTVSGLASATSHNSFMCSLDFPALFQDDETPLNPGTDVGLVRGWPEANAIIVPDDIWSINCNFWGTDCESWGARLPFSITWTTDASSWNIGDVYARIQIDTPASDADPAGWGWTISSGEVTVDSKDAVGSLDGEYDYTDVSADNYFRATHITLELDFKDSDVYHETVSTTAKLAIPNYGRLNQTSDLIDTSANIWDVGTDLADELVSVDLGTLETATRLWAYSQAAAAGMIEPDPDGLPENAVIRGISAFSDPIEDRMEQDWGWSEDAVETTAGPTIMYRDG